MAYADNCYVGKRVKLDLLDARRRAGRSTRRRSTSSRTCGVKFHSQNALDILEEHGATVDRETTVAKIPGRRRRAGAEPRAPHEFTLGGRNPEYDLPLDGEHIYISSDGCGVFYRDPVTGDVRSSRKEDLAELRQGRAGARQRRAPPSAVVSAQDCPTAEPRAARVRRLRAQLARSTASSSRIKEDWEARSLIEMAEALAGGRDELRKRPMFTAIICTVSPLHQERFGMDLALTLAEAGIPVSFYPMPILGATGPDHHRRLGRRQQRRVRERRHAGAARPPRRPRHPRRRPDGHVHELRRLREQLARGDPASAPCQGHMADFYGVPAWYGAGATTAKEPGIQSAYENALAMFMAYANGADVTFGTGLLDGSRILCLENMVVDDEIIGMVKRILRGVEVSEETLAVDLIKKMGFNGNYLFDNHTRAHVRELWQAKLGETGNYDGWKNAGARSTTEKAQDKVREILAAPSPSAFPTTSARVRRIIAAAEAQTV